MRNLRLVILLLVSYNLGAQDIDYVRTQATLLSAPDMSGRGYVKKGLEKAANVIAKEFEAIGLIPISERYRQGFNHQVNTFPGKMRIEVEGLRLEPGVDFLIEPNSPSIKGKYRAIVIGAEELATGKETYDQCEDCVIVIELSGEESKELRTMAYQLRSQIRRSHPLIWASSEKLTWSVGSSQKAHPIIEMRSGIIKNGEIISFDICAKLREEFESENVIGMVEGTAHPDSFVVFTAHYDHLGMMGKEATFYGANDNASGIAYILSLAKHYAARPADYSMVFIAFAGEEAGLVGSKYFVEHPLIELNNIRFLINLDLMGSGIDGITVVNAPSVPHEFELMKRINENNAYLAQIKSRKQTSNSDHFYFAEQDVPAVFIYALGGSTAYHDIYDISANLTFDEYEDIFRLLTDLVAKL